MGKRNQDFEIWQEGMRVATSTSLADALHYAMIYSQDGAVELKGGPPGALHRWFDQQQNGIAEPVTKE